MNFNNIIFFISGWGIFHYGMLLMEENLKELSGRSFKQFLQRNTSGKISSVFTGIIATILFQSSSIVTFLALSFVGAEIISMSNALILALGANIGTTLNNWIILSIGFNYNIENIAFPLITISSVGILFGLHYKKPQLFFHFGMGLGFLFIGLNYMKESTGILLEKISINEVQNSATWFLVLIGFIITVVVQSSSATMIILLSALYNHNINFETALAIGIGSELGTSIKLIYGAIGDNASKKKVVSGNIFFNLIITIISVIFLKQWIYFIKHILKIEDDEIGLLAFQTAINTFGLILMFPFFNSISKLLDHIFKENKDRSTLYLSKIENTANEATIDALEKETKLFIFRTLLTNLLVFKVDKKELELEKEMDSALEIFIKSDANHPSSYLNLKIAEGKILSFISEITETDKRNKDFKRFSMLISVIKHAMYAAKGIKDVVKDQEELQKSSKNEKYQHFELLQSQIIDLYKSMCRLMKNHKNENVYIELEKLLNKIQLNFQAGMNDVQTSISTKKINELEVSTLFNIDREMYSSGKAMIFAIKDYFLDTEAADKLENLPAPIFYHVSKNSVKTADDAYQI